MTRTAQRAFSGGIMSPGMYARRDITKWQTGLQDAVNVTLRAEGGVSNRAGTRFTGGMDNSTVDGVPFLVPFEASEDDTYMLEFADGVMRVLKNGAYIIDTDNSGRAISSISGADPALLVFSDSVDAADFAVGRLAIFYDFGGTSPLDTAILKSTSVAGVNVGFEIIGGTVDNTGGDWDLTGTATIDQIYQTTSPFAIEEMSDVQFVQDVDTMIFVHPNHDPQKLVRLADDDWTFSAIDIEPTVPTPTTLASDPGLCGGVATNTVGSGSTDYSYQVTRVLNETGEESLPTTEGDLDTTNDLTTSGNYNTISWCPASSGWAYRVYKEFNGIYGFIGITTETSFIDENITPDTSQNPPIARNPFDVVGTGDRPKVATFIDGRLCMGASTNNPQALELSSAVEPFNFNRALTPGASDAISFRMKSQKLNRVLHVVDATRPLILTAGAEWYIDTGDDGGIAPGNFALRPKTYRGSAAKPPPILVGETLLHVTRSGSTIREFSLDLARDTASADITLLARHLFRNKTIQSMAYAQEPDSIVWVTLTTGELYTLTYLEEHEVWGWSRHELGGTDTFVHQVATVTEGGVDVPYFVATRTLGYGEVTTIERLDNRVLDTVEDSYFVDCGLKYSGSAVTALGAYLHLRGEDITVLADGDVITGLSVDEFGQIALGGSYSKVAVGLGYEASVTTLDTDFGDQIQELGSSIGRHSSPSEVAIKVVDTRGITVGSTKSTFFNSIPDYTGVSPTPLQTITHNVNIEGDWGVDMAIIVKQTNPLPMTITAIAPTWTLGE